MIEAKFLIYTINALLLIIIIAVLSPKEEGIYVIMPDKKTS